MGGLLEHLGLDPSVVGTIEPGVAKLAHGTRRDWTERFRAAHPTTHHDEPI